MQLKYNYYQKVISLCLSLSLLNIYVPLSAQPKKIPVDTNKFKANEIILILPDVFDSRLVWQKIEKKFRDQGLIVENISDIIAEQKLKITASMDRQTQELAKIVAKISTKYGSEKINLLAKGSGGLLAKAYLQHLNTCSELALPVDKVINIGVSYQGSIKAKLIYWLGIPWPGLGIRPAVLRDISYNSSFIKKLNYYGDEQRHILLQIKQILKHLKPQKIKTKIYNQLLEIDNIKKNLLNYLKQAFLGINNIKLSSVNTKKNIDLKKSYLQTLALSKQLQATLLRLHPKNIKKNLRKLSLILKARARKIKKQKQEQINRIKRITLSNQKITFKLNDLKTDTQAQATMLSRKLASNQSRLQSQWQTRRLVLKKTFQENFFLKFNQYQKKWRVDKLYNNLTGFRKLCSELSAKINSSKKAVENNFDLSDKFSFCYTQQQNILQEIIAEPIISNNLPYDLLETIREKKQQNIAQAYTDLVQIKEEYIKLTQFKYHWQQVNNSRKLWLKKIAFYADNKDRLSIYQKGKKHIKQIKDTLSGLEATDKNSCKYIKELENLNQYFDVKLKAIVDFNQTPQMQAEVRRIYQEYQKNQRALKQAIYQLGKELAQQIIKSEYLAAWEAYENMEEQLVATLDQGAADIQTAIMATKLGGNIRELEMFAQVTHKGIKTKFLELEDRLTNHPVLDKLRQLEKVNEKISEQIDNLGAKAKEKILNTGLVKRLEAWGFNTKILDKNLTQNLDEIKKKVMTLDIMQELEKTQGSSEFIEKKLKQGLSNLEVLVMNNEATKQLEKLSNLEEEMQVFWQELAENIKDNFKKTDLLKKMSQITFSREQLVQTVERLSNLSIKGVASNDFYKLAAQVENLAKKLDHLKEVRISGLEEFSRQTIKELKQTEQVLWQTADEQIAEMTELFKEVQLYNSADKYFEIQEQNTQKIQHKLKKIDKLFEVRDELNKLKEIEVSLDSLVNSINNFQSLDNSYDNLDQETKEYIKELQTLGQKIKNAPKNIRQACEKLYVKSKTMYTKLASVKPTDLRQQYQQAWTKARRELLGQREVIANFYEQLNTKIKTEIDKNTFIASLEDIPRDFNQVIDLARDKGWQTWQKTSGAKSLNQVTAVYKKSKKKLELEIQRLEQSLLNSDFNQKLGQVADFNSVWRKKLNAWQKSQTRSLLDTPLAEFLNTLGFKDDELKKEMDRSWQELTKVIASAQVVRDLTELKNIQENFEEQVIENFSLWQTNLSQQSLLHKLDELTSLEDNLYLLLAGLGEDTKRALAKAGITERIHSLDLKRNRIIKVVDGVNKEIDTQLRTQGLDFNAQRIKQACHQVKTLWDFKIKTKQFDSGVYKNFSRLEKIIKEIPADILKVFREINLNLAQEQLYRELKQAEKLLTNLAGHVKQDYKNIEKWCQQKLLRLQAENLRNQWLVNITTDFLYQQTLTKEVQQGLDKIANIDQKTDLWLDQRLTQIQEQVLQTELVSKWQAWGFNTTLELSLEKMRENAHQAILNTQILKEINKLGDIKERFNQRVKAESLQLKRAEAAVVMQILKHRYSKLGKEVAVIWKKITWQAQVNNWTWDQALPQSIQFKVDQEIFCKLRQDIFRPIINNNPILQEMDKLKNIKKLLEELIQDKDVELRKKISQSEFFKTLSQIEELSSELRKSCHHALEKGEIQLLESQLANWLKKIGYTQEQLEEFIAEASLEVKLLIQNSELWEQLKILKFLPEIIQKNSSQLLVDIKVLIHTDQFIKKLDILGKDISSLWSQLRGEQELDLKLWHKNFSQHWQELNARGEVLSSVNLASIENSSQSSNLAFFWKKVEQSIDKTINQIAQELKLLTTLVWDKNVRVDFLNFIATPQAWFGKREENLRNYMYSFEFRFKKTKNWFTCEQAWQTLSDIFASQNWKWDWFEDLDGIMRKFTSGLDYLADKGLRWTGDRWQALDKEVKSFLADPQAWLADLDWQDISLFLDKYLPAKWRPAKRVLDKLIKGNYLAALDNLSEYFDKETKEKYVEYRGYYQQGKEYYVMGKQAWQALKKQDLKPTINTVFRVIKDLEIKQGKVYLRGRGRANRLIVIKE